jgi:hypothetical protein
VAVGPGAHHDSVVRRAHATRCWRRSTRKARRRRVSTLRQERSGSWAKAGHECARPLGGPLLKDELGALRVGLQAQRDPADPAGQVCAWSRSRDPAMHSRGSVSSSIRSGQVPTEWWSLAPGWGPVVVHLAHPGGARFHTRVSLRPSAQAGSSSVSRSGSTRITPAAQSSASSRSRHAYAECRCSHRTIVPTSHGPMSGRRS